MSKLTGKDEPVSLSANDVFASRVAASYLANSGVSINHFFSFVHLSGYAAHCKDYTCICVYLYI